MRLTPAVAAILVSTAGCAKVPAAVPSEAAATASDRNATSVGAVDSSVRTLSPADAAEEPVNGLVRSSPFCADVTGRPADKEVWIPSVEIGLSADDLRGCGCIVAVDFELSFGPTVPASGDAQAPVPQQQPPDSIVKRAPAWCCPSSSATRTTKCPTGRRPLLSREHSFDHSRACEKDLGRRFAHGAAFVADTAADTELGRSCGCEGERLLCCPGQRSWPEQLLTHCPD
jgi:hypothetical protein